MCQGPLRSHFCLFRSCCGFLDFSFDKGLALATLRSYRSAIVSCHRGFCDGSSVTNSPFLTRLLMSFFLKRAPSKTLLPAWSLPAIRKVLASAPFEPLHNASLCLFTIKTAFLVAIASGHRVSSLQALCMDPGHFRWEASGVLLIPRLGFIPKNQPMTSGSVKIFLPSISIFLRGRGPGVVPSQSPQVVH